METVEIRKAETVDLPDLENIYARARAFMVRSGNPSQWTGGYPSGKDILTDIRSGNLYACENEDGKIIAAFCFMPGPDPTYSIIEEGRWINDAPYHVIHRLASDGSRKGIAQTCFEWCLEQDRNIRVDTHRDNVIMQHVLESHGFQRCGIIYTHDHSPRIAFQHPGQR